MAKYERKLQGNIDDLLEWLHNDITNGSASASYEDGSDYRTGELKVSVRVYERYSMAGGNRVSLNITIFEKSDEIFVTAITSGGSQAIFFKTNTLGEETFLEKCSKSIENYIRNQQLS